MGNTQYTVLKSTYFMAVIDDVFCLDARVIYKCETLSVVTLEWSYIMGEIMDICTTSDTGLTVRDRRIKWVTK